jgi:hypothetical protein
MGVRDPVFTVEETAPRPALGAAQIALRGAFGGAIVGAAGFVLDAALFAVKTMRETKGAFDLWAAVWRLAHPVSISDWLELVGVAAFGVISGLFVAALTAARRGAGRGLAEGRAAAGN